MEQGLAERIEAVERLTKLFKTERTVYLTVTIISLVMLVASALSLMLRNKAGTAELAMMFGSGGLITYTAGRLLVMWSEAMKRLLPTASDAKEKS